MPLLLRLIDGQQPKVKRVFLTFYWFSFFHYLLMLYWIPNVMVEYGGMSPGVGFLGVVIMAAFFSLFTGAAGSLIKRVITRGPWGWLMVPVIWVAKDLVLEYVVTGFPWCFDGYGQYTNIYFMQLAEIGGVHLLTFLVITINLLLYLLFFRPPVAPNGDAGRHGAGKFWGVFKRFNPSIAVALAVLLVGIYSAGYYLYRSQEARESSLPITTAGILQPNTEPNASLDYFTKEKKLEEFFTISGKLADEGADFVVWPEFTVNIYPLQNKRYFDRFQHFVRRYKPLMAGYTDFQGEAGVYNSLILFQSGGYQKYDKVHLTPFGEYILYRDLLFFVKRITDEISDFTPGTEVANLTLEGHALSTPICYELIFPQLVRQFIHSGGEVIIITSNDSWYGDTAAPYQLLAMSVLRGVENRRYILRSTTNGISALVTPTGEIKYRSPFGRPDSFNAPFKYIRHRTFYTRWGYLFPFACLLAVLIYFLQSAVLRFHKKKAVEK